jgi:hypothetical protein
MNVVYVVNVGSGNVGEESENFRGVPGLVFSWDRCVKPVRAMYTMYTTFMGSPAPESRWPAEFHPCLTPPRIARRGWRGSSRSVGSRNP